jgi:hypothetical protein
MGNENDSWENPQGKVVQYVMDRPQLPAISADMFTPWECEHKLPGVLVEGMVAVPKVIYGGVVEARGIQFSEVVIT